MKNFIFSAGALILMLVFMFNIQATTSNTNGEDLSYILARSVAEAQVISSGVKCAKVEDKNIYCKNGDTFTFGCATTTGTDNCGSGGSGETLEP